MQLTQNYKDGKGRKKDWDLSGYITVFLLVNLRFCRKNGQAENILKKSLFFTLIRPYFHAFKPNTPF
jgi:hypothetical protein